MLNYLQCIRLPSLETKKKRYGDLQDFLMWLILNFPTSKKRLMKLDQFLIRLKMIVEHNPGH